MQDNVSHRFLHDEAQLVYDAYNDVPFSSAEVDCVVENLSLKKAPGSDRITN